MEAGSSHVQRMAVGGVSNGLFPLLAPVLLISIGYIDPGKWASCIDTGARFGVDLVWFAFAFNLMGVLCHYLCAHITVISGKNLAQICSEEYDKLTCFFLGIQAELSAITLDLTMIIGIAHGLNMIFGLDLFTCILLTALNVVLYPLFSTLLESSKVKFLVVCLAGITFAGYVLGMLLSLPELPAPSNSLLSKLSGESAFSLMSLLGASVMPHNFYLHSSIVQRYQGPVYVQKGSRSQDNIIISLTVSSGIFLVNYVLMNSAANVFYSNGLGLLSYPDAMSLLDQAYRNPLIPFASFLLLFLANQIMASSWEFCGEGGETMLHNFFNMDLPEWLHRATIRIFAVVPVLFCLWQSGAEGMYHMLMCTQVMVALLLPPSMIPLFRIASSRPIMGLNKLSPILEFVVLLSFIGMLGLELIFVVEMIFGESDWVGNLRWSMGINATSMAYVFLLVTACISLSFMLWLAATPLKSATARLESSPWIWDSQQVLPESYTEREENDVIETRFLDEEHVNKPESLPLQENSFCSHPDMPTPNYDISLPETIMDTVQEPHATAVEENLGEHIPVVSSKCHSEPVQSTASVESVPISSAVTKPSDDSRMASSPMKNERANPAVKILSIEGDTAPEKDDEGDTWESEESSKDIPGVGPPASADGPGSFRSLSGKHDDGGPSAGSLSRLSGLGRAARRQLAAALDEFWGQLYDFHGQITQEAKSKKLDSVFGLNSKPHLSLSSSDSAGKEYGKEYGMQFQSLGGRVSDNPINMNLYDAQNQLKLQNNIESAYRAHANKTSAALWSKQMQYLDSYGQSSSRNMLDAGERRYQSLHLPPSSDVSDHQPATVHGYQYASYLNRLAKERSDYAVGTYANTLQKSPSLAPNNYRESLAFALGQNTNGFNSVQSSRIQNLAVQRNSALQSDNLRYDPSSAALSESNSTKKYHSLPDISGLSVPLRNLYASDRSTRFDNPNSSMGFGSSVGRTSYDPSSLSSTRLRSVPPLAFDELSPTMAYRDSVSLRLNSGADANSLWSKQPFEQFGVANKLTDLGTLAADNEPSMMTPEPPSAAEMESKLLQSLRHCILKLLKLEGSEWLFRSNDGVDEDLIDRVAMRERFVYEVESQDFKQSPHTGDPQYPYSERKSGATIRGDDIFANMISSVPQCGEGCVWKADLVVSFGVWCIRRILELSLMESRPELWGKYTYVLNRLQGVVDVAFFKPRSPMSPCFCLQIPATYQMRSSPPVSNGMLPPASRPVSRGKVTTSAMLLEVIKDVEIAISCRKGRSGTAAGDVAFPKGKKIWLPS
uniref:Ethylene-insensitive protein 2 n=1 Tax=Chenopodium quinoa TaxID=63459 RepID=A0A803M297_CHEQI